MDTLNVKTDSKDNKENCPMLRLLADLFGEPTVTK